MKTKIILWIGALLLLIGGAGCEKELSDTELMKQQIIGTWEWTVSYGGVIGEQKPIPGEKLELTFTDNRILATHNMEIIDDKPLITDALWCHRLDLSLDEPRRVRHQQHDLHDRGRQRGGVRSAPRRGEVYAPDGGDRHEIAPRERRAGRTDLLASAHLAGRHERAHDEPEREPDLRYGRAKHDTGNATV